MHTRASRGRWAPSQLPATWSGRPGEKSQCDRLEVSTQALIAERRTGEAPEGTNGRPLPLLNKPFNYSEIAPAVPFQKLGSPVTPERAFELDKADS